MIPLGLIVSIEIIFRTGIWEPILKPNSHAYYSKQAKKVDMVFSDNFVDFITLGDSRARIGIDHGRLTEQQKLKGLNHLNMTMNRSHLTTFKAVTDWGIKNLDGLNTVVIAMTKTDFKKVHYGPFELSKIQPFQAMNKLKKTNIYREVGYKNGFIQQISNISALVSYRKDIKDFLTNPLKRFNALKTTQNMQNVYSNIGSDQNICGLGPISINNCDKLITESSLNVGRQNVFKRYCQSEQAINIRAHGQPKLSDKEIQNSVFYWTKYLRELNDNMIDVIIVLLPDHSILKNELNFKNEYIVLDEIIRKIKSSNQMHLLDLSNIFEQQELPACHYFYEMIHPNKYGTEIITDQLIKFLNDIDKKSTH